jgi:hypothetical protein
MNRARTLFPRLLGAAGLTAALVAVITAFSGIGYAGNTAAQAQYAPTNTTPPAISGPTPPKVGDVLTASPGVWSSSAPPTYSYQWRRCNTTGGACADVSGATAQTYTLAAGDVGSTLRVKVVAKSSSGTGTAHSPQTSIVQAAPAPAPVPAGKTIAAANVTLPDRLTVDRVAYSPSHIASHAPFVARFHVANSKGQSVQGALVYALGLPYSWARNSPEVPTDETGWATVTLSPTSNLPLRRGTALVIFVRARVQGQDLLAGSSSRRLVQITVR